MASRSPFKGVTCTSRESLRDPSGPREFRFPPLLFSSGSPRRMSADPQLADLLARHNQGHLLRWWEELDAAGRDRLVREIRAVDLDRLDDLIQHLVFADEPSAPEPSKV